MKVDLWIRGAVNSLHFKIASGVIGSVLLVSALHFVWEYYLHRTRLIEELRQSALRVSDVTLNSLLELAMVGRHPELLQGGVERLSHSSAEVRRISILDLSGRVRFSSDRDLVGVRLNRMDPGCIICHEGTGVPNRSAFYAAEEGQLLRYAAPIPNREGCHSCHDPAASLVGVLLVDHGTQAIGEKLRESFGAMLAKAGTSVLAILLALGFLLNRIVISRLKRLTLATSRIAGGNLDCPELESMVVNRDELGNLARSFREMATQLQAYCGRLEEKERVRISLLQRLVRSQEEERKTISRELHDQLGQDLSALLLALETLSSGQDRGVPEALKRGLEPRIRGLIDAVHRLAWQMRPSILDDYGLERALARHVEEVARTSRLSCDFHQVGSDGLGRVPGWIETTLYRVAQEAIANAVRHSGASQCSVVLIRNRTHITLLVEDNGHGFDPAGVVPSVDHGLGILGMRERVTECGGSFDLESSPLNGTTVRARIPLEEAA